MAFKKLYSNMFFRNMLTDIIGRDKKKKRKPDFIAYFQYKLDGYKDVDHFLYFPWQPAYKRYCNEIFNKLNEYDEDNLSGFLDFHYQAFDDKEDFLQFLSLQTAIRLERRSSQKLRDYLAAINSWIADKRAELKEAREREHRQQLAKSVGGILSEAEGTTIDSQLADRIIATINQTITPHFERTFADASDKFEVAGQFIPKKPVRITRSTPVNEARLIGLFKLLTDIRTPMDYSFTEQFFNKWTDVTLSYGLKILFDFLKDADPNTLQKRIRTTMADLQEHDHDGALAGLEKALQFYFYREELSSKARKSSAKDI